MSTYAFNSLSYFNVHEANTTRECILSDAGDAVRDGDAGQTRTSMKCRLSDVGDSIRDENAGKTCTAVECILSDTSDSIRNLRVLTTRDQCATCRFNNGIAVAA